MINLAYIKRIDHLNNIYMLLWKQKDTFMKIFVNVGMHLFCFSVLQCDFQIVFAYRPVIKRTQGIEISDVRMQKGGTQCTTRWKTKLHKLQSNKVLMLQGCPLFLTLKHFYSRNSSEDNVYLRPNQFPGVLIQERYWEHSSLTCSEFLSKGTVSCMYVFFQDAVNCWEKKSHCNTTLSN